MRLILLNFWSRLLRIGHDDALNQKQLIRLHTLNAFAFASILFVLVFSAVFVSVGSYSALESLPIALVMLIVLWLNSKKRFEAAKAFMVFFLILVVLGMALSDRRTGTEYVLIVLACSSILIFDEVLKIFVGFVFSLTCFGFYLWYDTNYAFVPDPTVPYGYMKSVVMLFSACAVAVQLLVFRSLINKYAEDLQEAHKKGLTTNEELKASNDELHSLSEQLDWIVKQKSNELQSYIDAINVHVYSAVTDISGTILKVNEPFMRATGYNEEELIGKNISILHAHYQKHEFYSNGAIFHSEDKTWRGEVKKKRKDGSHFWVDKVIIPLKNASVTTNYFLILALPITERKEAEEQKERISMMLEDITFRASHKVRGPIARIQGLMNLMENGYIKKEEMSTIFKFLRISIDEMDVATRELTRFVNTHYEREEDNTTHEVDSKISKESEQLNIRQRLVKPARKDKVFDTLSKPCSEENPAVTSKETKPTQDQNHLVQTCLTILIAEDNAVNMLLAKSIIENLLPTARIIEAENGLRAVEKFKNEQPDIVFMDIRMPEKNGYEAAMAIREYEYGRGITIPIVALTAGTAKGEREKCLKAGMNDYISKPIVQDSIEKALMKWLNLKVESNRTPQNHIAEDNLKMHFDFAELKYQLGHKQELVKRLLTTSISNITECVENLHHSKSESKIFSEVAHKLRGIALSACFKELAKLAAQLEETNPGEREINALLKEVEAEVDLIKELVFENLNPESDH